jgi:hypothetical protein
LENKVKVTLERLREIITEEVIKEEVSPEDATRTIVALLQGTESKVTAEIMGAVYDDMYDSDVGVPEPEEGDPVIGIGQRGKTRTPDTGTGEIGFNWKGSQINEIIQEELEALLNEASWSFKDPGPHVKVHPDSHWGQQRRAILDKKEKDRAWAAGAEARGKEIERKERHKVDTELQNKLHSYIAKLKTFIEKARTDKGDYGDDKNIMDDIVALIYGKMPYRYAADISSIDRKRIQELGDLIRALAKPYNAASQTLVARDREIHQSRPAGPEKSQWEKEMDRTDTDFWLASHGIMQESAEIEIIDD